MATNLTFASLTDDLHAYAERAFTLASDPTVYNQIPRIINRSERELALELKVQGFIKNVVFFFQPGVDVYDKPDRWREWISVNRGSGRVLGVTMSSEAAGLATLTLAEPHGWAIGQPVTVFGVAAPEMNGTFTLQNVTQMTLSYNTGTANNRPPLPEAGLVAQTVQARFPVLPRAYEYLRGYWPDSSLTGDPLYYADYDYFHFLVAPVPRFPYPCELNYYELPVLLDDGHQTNWLTDLAPALLLHKCLVNLAPFLKNAEATATWQAAYATSAQAVTGQDLAKIQDRTSARDRP